MFRGFNGRLREAEDDVSQWFQRRTEDIEHAREKAAERGRALWNDATRTGARVVARTQKEIEALGASQEELQQREQMSRGAAKPQIAKPGVTKQVRAVAAAPVAGASPNLIHTRQGASIGQPRSPARDALLQGDAPSEALLTYCRLV